MDLCIYSKEDDSTATFNSVEHIIPKCIGGIKCLPKGWVSDKVNNSFSSCELDFARENPLVSIPRMFNKSIGRKKHHNKNKVGIFEDNQSKVSLGYIENGKPISLNQMIFSNLAGYSEDKQIKIKVILSPNHITSYEEQVNNFWNIVALYNGCPHCIQDEKIPEHTYILGVQDKRWFLGLSHKENPENIKPIIMKIIKKMNNDNFSQVRNSNNEYKLSSSQMKGHYQHCFNSGNNFRIYAKIAFNGLAFLMGRDYVMSSDFDEIRKAILTGENISEKVYMIEAETPLARIIPQFIYKVPMGKQYHTITFIKKDNSLYGFVSLYASPNPFVVKLSNKCFDFSINMYICDWENHKEYTLIDYVLKICEEDETQD